MEATQTQNWLWENKTVWEMFNRQKIGEMNEITGTTHNQWQIRHSIKIHLASESIFSSEILI